VPTVDSVAHRIQVLLPQIQQNMISDYLTVQRLAETCRSGDMTAWLTTLNVAVTRSMLRSEALGSGPREYYCIDGVPIGKLLGRFLGPHVRRVTGTDLVPYLCENLAQKHGPIAFVGENDRVARASIEALSRDYARSDLVHVPLSQNWRPSDPVAAAERTFFSSNKPGAVFVCLSHPKTQQWFHARRDSLPPSLYIGAGSALRVAGGYLARAPRPLRDRGFEWVGRLLQDPLRLGPRYAADLVFLVRLAFELSRVANGSERTMSE
jgi:exopolysaccharide biosynthesis WecB/TagA/CpsF family protein